MKKESLLITIYYKDSRSPLDIESDCYNRDDLLKFIKHSLDTNSSLIIKNNKEAIVLNDSSILIKKIKIEDIVDVESYDKVNGLDDDTFTYGDEIKGPRRSGKTTRMINDIVEKLFLGKKVMICGSALNEKLVQILQSRMAIEHSLSYHKKGKIPLGKIIRIEDFNSLKFKKDIMGIIKQHGI